MKLRWIKKYYRESDGFDGGKSRQSYDRILQYFDEGIHIWIDVPEVEDKKSKKKSEYESQNMQLRTRNWRNDY